MILGSRHTPLAWQHGCCKMITQVCLSLQFELLKSKPELSDKNKTPRCSSGSDTLECGPQVPFRNSVDGLDSRKIKIHYLQLLLPLADYMMEKPRKHCVVCHSKDRPEEEKSN